MKDRGFLGGLIHLHILHHACKESVFGFGLIEELATHGYKLSPGTLYPILHNLEKSGYLTSKLVLINGRKRRTYKATKAGRKALRLAKAKVWELFKEFFEEELQ